MTIKSKIMISFYVKYQDVFNEFSIITFDLNQKFTEETEPVDSFTKVQSGITHQFQRSSKRFFGNNEVKFLTRPKIIISVST